MTRSLHLATAVALLIVPSGTHSAASSQEQWRQSIVQLPEGVAPAAVSACVTDAGTPALRPSATAGLEAICGVSPVARCSIPGTEPIDLDLSALCRGSSVSILPAVRSVAPEWAARTPVTVEWRTWSGGATELIAARRLDPAQPISIPLSSQARLIRILRDEASPVTFAVPEAGAPPVDAKIAIPAAAAGGELFLYLNDRERESGTLVVSGTQSRIVGINGASFVSVPGLPPGNYAVRFGTIDVPIGGPIDFTIAASTTTELVPRLPADSGELRITGLVTFNGAPMPRQSLELVHSESDETLTTTTDDKGRYLITVVKEGTWVVRVVSEYDFGQIEGRADVKPGENVVDINLAGANVRLSFLQGGRPPEGSVEFFLDGPQRFSGIASDFSQPTELFAIPFGQYTVRAAADPDLVADAQPLVIDETPGPRNLTLDLKKQTGTLRVVDDSGGTPAGVRARAGEQLLRSINGMFDVRRVSPGTEIVLRAPGRVPACIVLQANTENVVTMRSNLASQQIRFDFAQIRMPPGRIRFSDNAQCTVPLQDFEWKTASAGFEITNLPNGVPVTYEYGSQTFTITAPGEVIVIR